MDRQEHIVRTPDTPSGWPRVAGTLKGVDRTPDLMASGWSVERALVGHPQREPTDLQALFAFMRDDQKLECSTIQARTGQGAPV